jgi:hypothetical protein
MNKLLITAAFLSTFAIGFGSGYAYNENLKLKLAASAAKSVAGTARTFLENSCEKNPDLARCKLLPKKHSTAQD